MFDRIPNSVVIVCTDRVRSMKFYQDVFGAVLLNDDYPMNCPWLKIRDLVISLLENTDRPSSTAFSEHAMAMLLIHVDDLEKTFRKATDAGARIVEPLLDGRDSFLFADPDGVFVEVMRQC